MKARSTLVHGALAAVGLTAAYVTWQRPPESRTDEVVVVVSASKKDIDKIRLEDDTRWIELTRDVEGTPVVWVKQGMFEEKLKALFAVPDAGAAGWLADAGALDAGALDAGATDSGAPDGGLVKPKPPPPPPPAPVIVPTRLMRGGDRADKLYEKFAPLQASRALGKLGADKRKELGLAASTRKLSVTVSGQTRTFLVAAPQAGVVGQYLEDEKDQSVFLLGGAVLADLEPSSQALVDRRLHAFRAPDFDAFEVTYEGGTRTFVQTGAEIQQTAKVAPQDAPDKPDEMVKNWHDKIFNRFIITEVLGKGEVPRGGEPAVVLRLRYFARGKDKGFLEVAKGQDKDVWAKSENTAGWVGVHAGVDEVLAEAKRVTTGQ